MLAAPVAGERSPRVPAGLARGRIRTKIPTLVEALTGNFTEHHARLVRIHLDDVDRLTVQIAELTDAIERAFAELDPSAPPEGDGRPALLALLARLDEIRAWDGCRPRTSWPRPGSTRRCSPPPDTSRPGDASWGKVTPRTIQSAAENTSGPAARATASAKGFLGQAAVGAGKTKTFLGARYRRLIKRTPNKKAVVAISRNVLEMVWVLIDDPHARYQDLGAGFHDLRRHRPQDPPRASVGASDPLLTGPTVTTDPESTRGPRPPETQRSETSRSSPSVPHPPSSA